MNKLFIILLAVCLVSVHAFVKRDAPAEKKDDTLENIQKQLTDIGQNINDKLKETFDPEKIKEGLNQVQDALNKALNDLKEKTSSSGSTDTKQ